MNKLKISFFSALIAMILVPLKGVAFSANDVFTQTIDGLSVGFKVKLNENSGLTVALIGKSGGTGSVLTVPSTIVNGGYTWRVVSCESNSGYNYSGITTLNLPESIEELGNNPFLSANFTEPIKLYKAFKTFSGTFRTTIPKIEVSEDNETFSSDEYGALYNKDKTTLYSVPTNYAHLTSDGTYEVASTVTTMRYFAFWLTQGMRKIKLPSGLTNFPAQSGNIVVFGIGNTTSGGPGSGFTAFEMDNGGNDKYKVIDGVLFSTATNTNPNTPNALLAYPQGKVEARYKVPEGITTIVASSIWSAVNMKEIDFTDVSNLQIGGLTNNQNLETVTLSKTMTLASVNGGITGSLKISRYNVAEGNPNLSSIDGVIFTSDKKTLTFYPPLKAGSTFTIPAETEIIAKDAFRGASNITEITIPATIKKIEGGAFANIAKLAKVTFEDTDANPAQVTEIGSAAFGYTNSLTEVRLPRSLTALNNIFLADPNLTTIVVPDDSKIESIAGGAFKSNSSLTNFTFEGSSALKTIGANAFTNGSSESTKITSFKFTKDVETIEVGAFQNLSTLSEIRFEEGSKIKKIGISAFARTNLKSVTLPPSIEKIGREAFAECLALEDISISYNARDIDPQAFTGSSNLRNISVEPTNPNYSSVRGYLLSHDKKTLVYYPEGKELSGYKMRLASSLEKIGDYAFFNNKKIKDVVIPSKVKEIGNAAFGRCDNLNKVTFLNENFISSFPTTPAGHVFLGNETNSNNMNNINIRVRKKLENQYKNSDLYKQFKNGSNPETSFFNSDNTEEYMVSDGDSVDILDVTKDVFTYVVPKTVENNGKTYTVNMISDYAFQNAGNRNINEVVIPNDLSFIGAKAFVTDIANNTSTIKNVFFTCIKPAKEVIASQHFFLDQTGTNYSEVTTTANIYVKKSATDTYQNVWKKTTFTGTTIATAIDSPFDYTSRVSYKVPAEIKTTYGTIAREFDVDFSDYYKTNKKADVAAFVAGDEIKPGTGDATRSSFHVRMTSIDQNGGVSGNYGYVPANTGVLLKVLDATETPADYYYTIGEQDDQTFTIENNVMHAITINDGKMIDASETNPAYVMRKGKFYRVPNTFKSGVHKAYLQFENAVVPAGSTNAILDFSDIIKNGTTTAIESITMGNDYSNGNNSAEGTYNINGQKVNNNPQQRGIYIQNGKKILVK